jgi:hypothetical protein
VSAAADAPRQPGEPLHLQYMRTCLHFTGLLHDACGAGVAYAAVRDESVRPYGFPCFRDRPGGLPCALARFRTEDEARAEEAAAAESIKRFFRQIADGACPHCGRAMTQRQVGRCVYAEPCGNRLYHGRATA